MPDDLVQQIELFKLEFGLTDSDLGELAVRDRSFVSAIRDGKRRPRLKTVEAVTAWMARVRAGVETLPARRPPVGRPRQPAAMEGTTAVFRVYAEPGEIVRLHVGVRKTTQLKPKTIH